jgi:hypothetical protein
MKATLQEVMDAHENINISRPLSSERDRAAYVSASAAILARCGWTNDEYVDGLCKLIEDERRTELLPFVDFPHSSDGSGV